MHDAPLSPFLSLSAINVKKPITTIKRGKGRFKNKTETIIPSLHLERYMGKLLGVPELSSGAV